MSDYTPTTEEKAGLAEALKRALAQCGISVTYAIAGPSELFDVASVLLKADWLAAHDRKLAAKAWDEGFETPRSCCGGCPLGSCPWDSDGPSNPYRATQIEKGAEG